MNTDSTNRHDPMLDTAMKSKCPIFLRKCYHMITCSDNSIVDWSQNGSSFYIKDVSSFSSQILPRYFKHSNFSSFIRQLNFYGFAKAKDIKVVDSHDSKYWQFHHEHFKRNEPELLVRIVRRLSGARGGGGGGNNNNNNNIQNVTSSGNINDIAHVDGKIMVKKEHGQDNAGKLLAESNVLSSVLASSSFSCGLSEAEQKERDVMKQEIEVLKGQLDSMQNEVKKLTDMIKSVVLTSEENQRDAQHNTVMNVTAPLKENVDTCDTATVEHSTSNKKQKMNVVPDSSLLYASHDSNGDILTLQQDGTSEDHPQGIKSEDNLLTEDMVLNARNTTIVTVSARDHVASMDLPDLGMMVGDDADADCMSMTDTFQPFSEASPSVEYPHNSLEDEDIVIPLPSPIEIESDIIPIWSDSPVAEVQVLNEEELHSLPALVLDEKPSSAVASTKSVDEDSSMDLLDRKHLLNLEKCLAMLPLSDRIKFVQDAMNNIQGLNELFRQQGLRVLVVTSDFSASPFSGNNNHNNSSKFVACSSSKNHQVLMENGFDTKLLTDFELLLQRVGLKIQLCSASMRQPNCCKTVTGAGCSSRRGTANAATSCIKTNSNKKQAESSFVKIEA